MPQLLHPLPVCPHPVGARPSLLLLEETAGILKDADYPEWESPEKTSAWVRERREEDAARLRRKLARNAD